MHENNEERRIGRLRRAARKQRLRVTKIPERPGMYLEYGPSMLVDDDRDWVVSGWTDADEIESELVSRR